MLNGQVFSSQLFESHMFALFINTFLDGYNGIPQDYKNGMAVTYSGSNVSIDTGAILIQGRLLEEDSGTTIDAGTDALYCKLVVEIDLDKVNTQGDFQQGYYNIVTSAGGYPTLTQTDIVNNVSGVYQYELARFRTTSSGITDFEDKRTFLDIESIYTQMQADYKVVLDELEEELADVEDGSAYVLKANYETLTANVTPDAGGNVSVSFNYPIGFNQSNTIVLQVEDYYDTGIIGDYIKLEPPSKAVALYDNHIAVYYIDANSYKVSLRIMRI